MKSRVTNKKINKKFAHENQGICYMDQKVVGIISSLSFFAKGQMRKKLAIFCGNLPAQTHVIMASSP